MYLVPSYDVYIPHKLASVLFSIQDARAKCKNNFYPNPVLPHGIVPLVFTEQQGYLLINESRH